MSVSFSETKREFNSHEVDLSSKEQEVGEKRSDRKRAERNAIPGMVISARE